MSTLPVKLRILASGIVAVALLGGPAGASAAKIVFGSKLNVAATRAFPRPVDTAFWSTKLSGGGKPRAPASGQILTVSVKGCAVPGSGGAAPITTILFQDLRPAGASKVTVQVTSSPFNLPICASGGAAPVTVFHPVNMCAKKGDYVGLTDVGGFATGYPAGVAYRVFGRAPGAGTSSYTMAGGVGNGATLTGTKHAGAELLMQMQLGTGRDGTALCPGGGH